MSSAYELKNKRPSRRDVAKLAGVSRMTVSRVMQSQPSVAPETRRKVLAACKELNYRVNLLASYMSTKRSYVLGVVCPTLAHGYYVRFINAIEMAASKLGYHIIVIQLEGDLAQDWSEKLEFLLQRQVDGIIFSSQLDQHLTGKLAAENVPIVLTGHESEGFSDVRTDDYTGALEAVRYLIGLGHRDIAYISGIPGSYASEHRYKGYMQALTEAGIELRSELVVPTNYDLEEGYKAALELLSTHPDFSAIFAVSDYSAVGAMLAIRRRGLSIPDDISVVGFSGDIIGEYSFPPLTTVYQPVEQVGQQAVDLMMKQIDGTSEQPTSVLVPNRLIVRESCAKGPYAQARTVRRS